MIEPAEIELEAARFLLGIHQAGLEIIQSLEPVIEHPLLCKALREIETEIRNAEQRIKSLSAKATP